MAANIHSIMALFFNNRIFVNVNGHFTTAIDPQRSQQQGDSPLLFNVAIEPFLLAIQHDQQLQGFTLYRPSDPLSSSCASHFPSLHYLRVYRLWKAHWQWKMLKSLLIPSPPLTTSSFNYTPMYLLL